MCFLVKTLQTLFSTHANTSGRSVSTRERRFENRELWGLLWGPLIHLGASRHISNHLATTTEPVEPARVAGLSAFRSTSYLNRWKWSPEPAFKVRARLTARPLPRSGGAG